MMDREPFAFPVGSKVVVYGKGRFHPIEDPEDVVALLNAAVDARVKEEVKRAVDEFRIRVVQDIKKFGELMAKDDWNKSVGSAVLFEAISDDIAELVGSLPTEPEGGKVKKTIKAWAGFLDGKVAEVFLARKDTKYDSNDVRKYEDLRDIEISFEDDELEAK